VIPQERKQPLTKSTSARSIARTIGTAVLVAGLLLSAYGAVAFWLIQRLPPNGGASGRLPSLYVMGVGLAVSFIGLMARDLRFIGKRNPASASSQKAIPTSLGIFLILAIVIAAIAAISLL
jgi:hypothetical protein